MEGIIAQLEGKENRENLKKEVIRGKLKKTSGGAAVEMEEIRRYCLSKRKAYETFPFGEVPICYKVNNKIFAQLYPVVGSPKITLKCTARYGDFYRTLYPGKVVRGYHCPPVQQPYWNTVYLENFPEEALLTMIDQAYDTVVAGFSKKVQRQILEEEI